MNPAQLKFFSEFFIKVLGNQSLIMLALASVCESEAISEALREQSLRTSKECSEAIDYIRKQSDL